MNWSGAVALVLAVGVAIAMTAGVLIAELSPGPLTTEEVSLYSTIAGAAVGAVATYLGVQVHDRRRSDMTTEQPPEPEPTPDAEPEPVPVPDDDDETEGEDPSTQEDEAS